jgi:hypothetical protein
MQSKFIISLLFGAFLFSAVCAEEGQTEDTAPDTVDATDAGTSEEDLGSSREGSRTDDEVVQREEEAIQVCENCDARDLVECHVVLHVCLLAGWFECVGDETAA